MVSNNNIVPLRVSSTTEKIDKAKSDLWSDYLKTRKRIVNNTATIDEITPEIFAVLNKELEAGKISGLTASKILLNLNNIVHKQELLSLAKLKAVNSGGTVIEETALDKHANKSTLSDKDKKAMQKAAESALVELTKLKLSKQSTEA